MQSLPYGSPSLPRAASGSARHIAAGEQDWPRLTAEVKAFKATGWS